MKKTTFIIGSFLILLSSCSTIYTGSPENVESRTHRDLVPDEETARKIAEAIWLPLYGEEIYQNKPFKVSLQNGTWIVRGTLPPEYDLGGTPYIEIQKYDCKVLNVSHGK